MHSAGNAKVTLVHYKGTGQMMPDLLAGRIHATAITFLSSMPHIKSGKTRALGITTLERAKLWPDLPTVAEQGAPGFNYAGWLGVLAPAKTPQAIIGKLNATFTKAAQDPGISKKLASDFVQFVTLSPNDSARFIKDEIARWKGMSDEIGVVGPQ